MSPYTNEARKKTFLSVTFVRGIMSAAGNYLSAEGVKVMYDKVIYKLVAVSEVEDSQKCLPYFNLMLQNESKSSTGTLLLPQLSHHQDPPIEL